MFASIVEFAVFKPLKSSGDPVGEFLLPKKDSNPLALQVFLYKRRKTPKHAKNEAESSRFCDTLCVDETHTKIDRPFLICTARSVSVRPRRAECVRHFRLFVAEDVLYRFRENNIRRVHEDDVVCRMLRFVFDFVEYELFSLPWL